MATYTDELAIRVTTERGENLLRPTVDRLRQLLERIGVDGDCFLILEPSPFRPREFMQVHRELADDFTVEYRSGYRQYGTTVAEADTVLRTMVAWADQHPSWRTAHDWGLVLEHEVPAVAPLSDAVASYAREIAEGLLSEGSSSFDLIVQNMMESSDPDEPVSRAQAEAILEPMWADWVEEQETWPQTTDADRLKAVFEQLNRVGITARMNFSCCQTCAVSEIREEANPGDRGFVYYHQQDAVRAAGGSLYLAFGAYSKVDPEGVAVGRDAVVALESAGFTTQWNGTVGQRILITDLDWKQRLS